MTEKRHLSNLMRSLHRDIGFLLIGLTIVYCVSGLVLIYRDRGFMRLEKKINITLQANLAPNDLGKALGMRKLKIINKENGILYFHGGTYNIKNGETSAVISSYPSIIEKMNRFHMQSSGNLVHILAALYGVLLLFLAVSSFWMYRPGSRFFKRGLVLSGTGIAATMLLLLFF